MQNGLAEKPESYLKIIKRSLLIYRASIIHVFFLALLVSAITFIPRLLSILIGQNIFYPDYFSGIGMLWFLFIYAVVILFFTALLWRIRCVITENHESLLEDMEVSIRKLPYIIVGACVQWVIFAILGLSIMAILYYFNEGFILSLGSLEDLFQRVTITLTILSIEVMISIYLFFLFIFYLPIILTEHQGIIASIIKSVRLVWRNWWFTFWVLITPVLVYLLFLIALRYGLHLNIHIYFAPPLEKFSWITTCLHIVVLAIFLPWMASALLAQLRNLELRKALTDEN